ncbi:MAG TPA: AI-2E family transporter [Gaiellaceae bacterium]|nr:AI-2E family transporter [Gaiellaceae bacterium]
MPPRAPIVIPRWIQLVGLPLLLLLAWAVAGAVRHAVFVFLVAAIVALLLDPLVRRVEAVPRVRVPRGLAVAVVYLGFAAVVAIAVVGLATVVVDRTTAAVDRVDAYVTKEDGRTGLTGAENDVERFQQWLDGHGLERIQVEESARRWLDDFGATDVTGWTQRVLDFVEGAAISIATLLFTLVLVVVVSVYMLLDMPRLSRALDRRFPPHDDGPPLTDRVERALVGYVTGQLLVSAIIGASAGLGMWALGALGWVPGADRYALVFGAWVALTELIPYLGPWLGAVPPALYALVVEPVSVFWVALLFLAIHQIEGHVVIPNVMSSALRLHPLLVIFGLLAGAEIYGLAGALVALPVLAASRALWEFFADRVALEAWREGRVTVEVEEEDEDETLTQPPAAAAG